MAACVWILAACSSPPESATTSDSRGIEVFGTLRGIVLLNGKPFRGRVFFFDDRHATGLGTSDKDGTFEGLLQPGSYAFGIWHQERSKDNEYPPGPGWLMAPERFAVVAERETRQTFRITLACLRLQVLGPDGKPRMGVAVVVEPTVGSSGACRGTTDKDGKLVLGTAPGKYQLMVWPERLADRRTRASWRYLTMKANDPNAADRVLIPLAVVEAKVEDKKTIKIRLPEAAGY